MSDALERAKTRYFRSRRVKAAACIIVLLAVVVLCDLRCGFDPIETLLDLPGSVVWSVEHFTPTLSSLDKLPKILLALWKTFLGAAAAALVSAVLAYVLALAGCRAVGLGGAVRLLVRGIASISRNIPNVAWAFMLMFSFGQSEFTGFLVLFMKSFGFLARMFLETIDEVPQGAIDALRSVGATRAQIVFHALIPLTSTQVISWLLYMVETNARDATLVGMLTGSGIGFVFELYYRTFRYDIAGLVIVCIALMALLCEAVSNYVRRRIIAADAQPSGAIRRRRGRAVTRVWTRSRVVTALTVSVLAGLTVCGFSQMSYGDVDLLRATFGALNNFAAMALHPGTDGYWTMGELLSDLGLTLALAMLTTVIGASLALLVALPAACNLTNRAVSNAIKLVLSVIRAVPTIIWVLVFVVSISLGAEACIIGMMFHTVAFLAKAYSEAFEEVDPGVLEALRSTGATWWQTVIHCILPEKANDILSWTFLRLENNFVNTVVIAALCGSGGIGYELYLAANFYFSMHAVGLITYLCLAVSMALEAIAARLHARFEVDRASW